ncbi:Protein CASP [Schistosoma japonicum]|uniref:Protein CASP n=1 Tax=Schistosoma japonicum TaxID=6182 RepID=A0A4Z2CP57_SCHJA|nr:Protein CASP [Schistosoma japonicum]
MEGVVTSVYNSWRDVEFSDLQKTLESVACELTANHEKNDISRNNLVNQTKEFRKSAPEDVRKSSSTVIKCYQAEFDALQKRCKYAEDAYLSLYKRLIELPDPSFALGELHSLQKRADKATEFEFESRKFKETCDELKAKVQELKSHERENKRLQKRLDELTTSLNSQIQLNTSRIVDEYQRKLESREQELAVFRVEAEEKLSNFESKNLAISKALEMAQSELFRLKTEVNTAETGRSSELELLMDDLEKSNVRLASAEAELAKLREDRTYVPHLPDVDVSGLQSRIEELEFELSNCSQQKSSLLDQLESLKLSKSSNEATLENRVQELENAILQTKKSLEEAYNKLESQSDYEEIKRELSLLHSIEFPEDFPQHTFDSSNRESSGRAPLEVLLLRKNKLLENQLAEVNGLRDKLQIELTQVKSNEAESKQRIEEQTELIKLLESDLYRLQTSFDESLKLNNDSTSRLESHFLAEVIGEQKTNQYDQSLLNIVQNQRDRFRSRAEELEQNEINLRQQLASLQREVESVRADNVKLYEKIRFLHSYGSPSIQTRSNNSSSSNHQPSSPLVTSHQNPESNDATIIKYSQVYEAQLNPFNQFSRYEKQRVYKKLQPHEKLMLHLGRFIISDRRLRLGLFLYAIFLHLFIFVALYKAAHFQHSALETEANCHSR